MSTLAHETQKIVQFRSYLWNLVLSDLKLRYRRSVLGVLWSMLNPLLMILILYIIFSELFASAMENYAAYVITGILVWQFYAQSTSRPSRAFLDNGHIIKKANVPKSIFVLAIVLATVINFIISLIPAIPVLILSGVQPGISIVLLPFVILLMTIFVLGVALLLSTVSVFFHDVLHIYEAFLMLLMYASALFYPIYILPSEVAGALELNPVFHYVSLFRIIIYGEHGNLLYYLASCFIVSLTFAAIGFYVYAKNRNNIIYYV